MKIIIDAILTFIALLFVIIIYMLVIINSTLHFTWVLLVEGLALPFPALVFEAPNSLVRLWV